MTWLLARLGLSRAVGETLLPIAAFIAACVAALGLAVYVAHALTRAGYRTAVAECEARNQSAVADKREAETRLSEANREVILRHVADTATLKTVAPTRQKEIIDYDATRPVMPVCDLDPIGLRLWNADPLGGSDAPLPIRPTAAVEQSIEPASGGDRHAASPDGQPQ